LNLATDSPAICVNSLSLDVCTLLIFDIVAA
jgi:hypothetical protein